MSESKTIQVTATPEVLAEMGVRPVMRHDIRAAVARLHWPSGAYAGLVSNLPAEDSGAAAPVSYMRAWLVGHITAAYETGKAEGEKASKDDLGWHAAMGHVAQILGVDDSGDPKAIEERIRAEVSRLKDRAACAVGDDVVWLRARIADLTTEVERLTAENSDLRDKSPAGPYASGFLEARRRVWEYLDNREVRLSSARKEAERLHRESATADKQVAALSSECAALQEALDAIGEVTES